MAKYLTTIHLAGGTKEQIIVSRFEFSQSEETGEIVGYEMDTAPDSDYRFVWFRPNAITGIKIEVLEEDEQEEPSTD